MNIGKIAALSLALMLGMAGAAEAAVPTNGVFLNKDGTPVAPEDIASPQVVSASMPVQDSEVFHAMQLLPHSTVVELSVRIDEYGISSDVEIQQSSGSVILDNYAITGVQGWKFKPAHYGDKNISALVLVPLRFQSTMVAVPAAPTDQPMKALPEKVRAILSAQNRRIDVPLLIHLDPTGKLENTPEAAPWDGTSLTQEEQKTLRDYAITCVKDWIFTPAQNPDGESIRSDQTIIVEVK